MIRDYKKIYFDSKKIISDDKFMLYVSDKLKVQDAIYSDDESDKVSDLELFYRGILDYACSNYIYPVNKGYDEYFYVEFKNKFYKLGVGSGQGIYFYIKNDKEHDNCIKFNDVINNVKSEKTILIDDKILEIKKMIDFLYNENVSLEIIENAINKYLDELNLYEEKKKYKKRIFEKK